jgi:phage shock protein PspC (stress-responsive transcriptional regulator)
MDAPTTPPPPSTSQPPPPQGPAPARLARPRDDRVVSGVAAGIANHFGVDPVWVRVLFAIAAFAAGSGVLVYLVLALSMPEVDHSPPPGSNPRDQRVFWIAAAVILFFAATTFDLWPRPGILVPIAIVAVGVALWQRPSGARRSTDAATPPPRPPDGGTAGPAGPAMAAGAPAVRPDTSATTSAAGSQPGATVARGAVATAASGADRDAEGTGGTVTATVPRPAESSTDPVWWTPPQPRPRPSMLGPVVVAIALMVAVVQVALDGLDVIDVTPTQGLATALAILGVGMLVGAFWGRAKWLSAPALVLAAALVVVQTSDNLGIEITPNVVDGTFLTADAADIPSGAVGDLRLDLAQDPPAPGEGVEVQQGLGSMRVIVPWNADVDLSATVGAGQVELREEGDVALRRTRSLAQGLDLSVERELMSPWTEDGTPLTLDLGMGAGQITIVRQAPPEDAIAELLEDQ